MIEKPRPATSRKAQALELDPTGECRAATDHTEIVLFPRTSSKEDRTLTVPISHFDFLDR
jgi:hypothetical protein